MGVAEFKNFAAGTVAVAEAMAASGANYSYRRRRQCSSC
jgi:3-phosphoglycerate kinase